MRYRIKPSNVAGIIAGQMGNMKADLRIRIASEIREISTMFANECPPPSALPKLINTLNILNSRVNSFKNRITPFRKLISNLEKTLNALINLIKILKLIPIPTATGSPPTGATSDVGGFFFAIPVKITNKYADLLRLTSELAASVEDDIKASNDVLKMAEDSLTTVIDELDSVRPIIEQCVLSPSLSAEELKRLKEATQGLKRENQDELTNVSFRSSNGKDYELSIITDPNSPNIAPRRFAVAKDQRGIIVLKGSPSFASSTKVLIDELKYRIDNQLP